MFEIASVNATVYNSKSGNSHLSRDIKRLERDVLRMGALVEQSFRLSHQALFARDLSAAKEIPPLDKKIDRFYKQIESDCTLIITPTPNAQDLRYLSAFMQLVRDLERIGDYAEDLSEIAIKIFPYEPHYCLPQMAVMSRHAQAMLATCLESLADLDEISGQSIKQLDDAVDDAYDQIYHTLASQRDVPGVVEPIVLMALALRCLERMADHATNIGQRVAYIVTGQRS